jgi:type IV secretion system protein VirD4
MKRALIFTTCLMLGLWAATFLLVDKLNIEGFFLPWLWLKWFYLYGNRFQSAFADTIWPIYASIALGIALAWIPRLLFSKKNVSTAHGSSRWADEKEISFAGLASGHGVILGQSMKSKKLLSHDGPEHIIAIAPTRGGKGVGLVVPTLLNWPESAVIFDPKGENWQITSGYRSSIGECLCFDPTSLSGARFNPLMEIRKGDLEVKDAQNIADIIVDPDGRLDTRNHWQNAAHSLLVGTILHVIHDYQRKSLAGVVEFLTKTGVDFEQTLNEMAKSQHPVVTSVAQEMLNKHIEERSGVLSTAISLLAIFRDPLVAQATDAHDFNISALRNSVTSLYLVLPPSDISRLRVLLRVMLNQMGRVLTEQIPPQGKQRRILFLLDEFPALGRLEFFESALAYMAGYGLKAFLICQSLNQLQKAYGERNAILDNCHVRVAFANNDDQTARRLSDLLGEQTLSKEQTSISGSRFSMVMPSTSVSNIEYGRPLLLPSEINRLPNDQEIILINGMHPILANKVRYYTDNRFSRKLLPACAPKKRVPIAQDPIKATPPMVELPKTLGSSL